MADWAIEISSAAGVGTADLLNRVVTAMDDELVSFPSVDLRDRKVVARLGVRADSAERAVDIASLAFRHFLLEAGVPHELASVDEVHVSREEEA